MMYVELQDNCARLGEFQSRSICVLTFVWHVICVILCFGTGQMIM